MIRLLDVPGVAAIETRVTLNDLTGIRSDHELARMIEALQREIFGVTGDAGLQFEWIPDEDEPDNLDDVTYWARAGWDVTDASGDVLRCFDALEDALVCVSFGYAGRSTLEIEADLWRQRQAANSNVDPKRVRRDQSYLAFGGRRAGGRR